MESKEFGPIENCKLKSANCKMPEASPQFAICNSQFSICDQHSNPLTLTLSPEYRGEGTKRVALVIAAWLTLTSAVFAQRDLKDIPPPDPELERQTLQLGEGLEINLYAADPLLAKPIQMNFDRDGRLWVATSETYPHILPGQEAHDKIIVLEDADRDGRADKPHVFADGLLIPTGIEPGDGGCYVANSTELLHFADTDGDLKSDVRKTLLSGFGTEDTHHLLHTLRWGPDGRLYMNQSIYIHSHIETPYGVRRLNGGGIWQYEPKTHRLEIFARGWVNAWGHAFDRWGQSFVTDGAGGEGINYAFPGSVFPTAPGAPRVLHGLNPGSPKYCGLEIISGRHWPDDWQGDLITCDFRAHRIVRFKVAPQGSGYTAQEQSEVIKTNHVAFRPIDVKLGPDGALYIADWYNPIIQHGEVDFRDPRRDHTHGRIWRVTVKGREPAPAVDYAKADDGELFRLLDAPEDFIRQRARNELLARNASTSREASTNPRDRDQLILELLRFLSAQKGTKFVPSIDSENPHYRAAALRIAGPGLAEGTVPVTTVARFAADDHPQVRLEAICALRNSPTFDAVAAALSVLDHPMDENLDFALWQLCRERRDAWLPDVIAEKSPLYDRPAQLEFALRAIDEPLIVAPLLKLIRDDKVADDRRSGILQLVARLGSPQDLAMILRLVLEESNDDVEQRLALLGALAEAATTRRVQPAGDLSLLDVCLEANDERVATAAARLLGLWKVESVRPVLTALARAKPASLKSTAAVEAIGDLGGPASQQALIELASDSFSGATRQAAVMTLVKIFPQSAAQAAVALLADVDASDIDAAAIVEAFMSRQGATAALTKALADKKLPADVAKLALRTARSSAKPDEALVAALRTAGGLEASTRPPTPEEISSLTAEVKTSGDAARGEAIYHRRELGCVKCHAVGGAGGRVGPDLVSIGASAQVDYLVESLLLPNKAIKEGFHTLVVTTDDGRSLNGVQVRKTDKDLILRDAEDREIAVPLKSIEEQSQGLSLMPTGLPENLTRKELVDLVRFLSELGKVGPYQLKPAPMVRRWEAFITTPQGVEVLRRNRVSIAATGDGRLTWEPAYARFDGGLPLAGLGTLAAVKNQFMSVPPFSIVRFEFDAARAGRVALQFNTAAGLQLWLDGKPLDAADRTTVDVAAGRHTVTVAVDRVRRSEPLRCELVDDVTSPAGATPVTVK